MPVVFGVLLFAHVAFGCDTGTDNGADGGSGFIDELTQPLGGLMFAALETDGTTAVHYAMRGDAHAASLIVSAESTTDDTDAAPPSIV